MKTTYKNFDDLQFEDHEFLLNTTPAHMYFENGYGVSVVHGMCDICEVNGTIIPSCRIIRCDKDRPYEVAVLKDGNICYTGLQIKAV